MRRLAGYDLLLHLARRRAIEVIADFKVAHGQHGIGFPYELSHASSMLQSSPAREAIILPPSRAPGTQGLAL
jgi:hypothetical protein